MFRDIKEFRNVLWLIKLRWLAILCLLLLFFITYILDVKIHTRATQNIIIILFAENVFLIFLLEYVARKKQAVINFFSECLINFQIALDFIILTFLLHYNGGVENPFIIYYIFHMVLSSIILPTRNSYILTAFALVLIGLMAFLEFAGIVPHYKLEGFVEPVLYNNLNYLLGTGSIFITTSFLVVFFTSSLAKNLKTQKQEYQDANMLLNKKDKVKNEYVLRLTFKIKETLASIQANLAVITENAKAEAVENQETYLSNAFNKTTQLSYLTNSLLTLTRLKMNDSLQPVTIQVHILIFEIIESLKFEAGKKSVSVHSVIDPSVKTVHADKDALKELLLILLSNAIRYSMPKGEILVKAGDSSEGTLFSVSDTGIGIPVSEKNRIFDEFYRAPNAIAFFNNGVGLGLAIASQILSNNHWSIDVESKENNGACFTFTVPKMKVNEAV